MTKPIWMGWSILIASMLAFGVSYSQGNRNRPNATKQWLTPDNSDCPMFRYGPDTSLEEATSNCMDYCTKSQKCKSCNQHSGPTYPDCTKKLKRAR
jgi:hypothetical protein